MPIVSANGETISYVREGTGPAVVMIHSLGSSKHMWREQIDALKSNYTVVTFDCRGHGQSSANGETTTQAAAIDLKTVLDHAGIKTCHIVGMDMGGPIALLFNQANPGVARSLVLASTHATPPEGSRDHVDATKEMIAYVSMEEFAIQYAAQRLLASTSLDIQDELAKVVASVAPKVYNETMRSAVLGDVSATLAAVNVPTLVLAGDQDDIVPPSSTEQLAAGIAGAKLDTIPDAGHLSNLDNPSAFNDKLKSFLGGIA